MLVPDEDAWRRFDGHFAAYWLNAGRERRAEKRETSRHARSNAPYLWRAYLGEPTGHADDPDTPDEPDAENEAEAAGSHGRPVATHTAYLRRRDLRELTDETTRNEALATGGTALLRAVGAVVQDSVGNGRCVTASTCPAVKAAEGGVRVAPPGHCARQH